MRLRVLTAVAGLFAPAPPPADRAPAPGSASAREEHAGTEHAAPNERTHEATTGRPFRVVWEAGAGPVTRAAFFEAVTSRLPPEGFDPVSDEDATAWTILVRRLASGLYHLEIAGPGRSPVARRIRCGDPNDCRRRLALLSAYALEHGDFPPAEAGSGVEVATPTARTTPPRAVAEPARRRPAPPAPKRPPLPPRPEPERPSRRPPLRIVVDAGGVLALSAPPRGASAPLGGGGGIGLGLGVGDLAWLGIRADAAVHPGGDLVLRQTTAGVFAGVLPAWGWGAAGVRVAAEGGAVFGSARSVTVRRGFAAGSLDALVAVALHRAAGLFLAAGGTLRITSRASVFETPDQIRGLGRVRGAVTLSVLLRTPPLRRRRAAPRRPTGRP